MSLTAVAAALMMGSALPQAPVDAAQQVAADAPEAQPLPEVSAPMPVEAPIETPAEQVPDGDVSVQEAAVPAVQVPADTPPEDGVVEGDTIIVTRHKITPGDPLEHINAQSFEAVQAVDAAVLEPVAKAYNKGLPRPVRQGLRNFFNNLGEPVVALAFLLELKPGKALETVGRFAINTTLGVAGFLDIAKRKPFKLPYRPNGLANVLGYYGVGPGPYMYLPLIGPTTLRDLIGDTVDNLASPTLLGKPFNKTEVVIGMAALSQLGERAAFDDEINRIRKADNPYATYRDLYLRQREAEIEALHGRTVPDVVPVYGPGLRTAGGKDQKAQEAESTDEAVEAVEVVEEAKAQP